jgi:ectoine hydroxylase-related dioxygenase (phytanoyl-CoA dioxygenase family)
MNRWEVGSEFHWTAGSLGMLLQTAWLPTNYCLCGTGTAALMQLAHLLGDRQRRIHIPSFFCMDVPFKLQKYFEVVFYQDLPTHDRPHFSSLSAMPGDIVVAVNFFGGRSGDCWQAWAMRHPDVILVEDHTQDPGSPWAQQSQADYCIASLHKTLPIPDGAILWSPKGLSLPLIAPVASAAAEMRLAAMLLKQRYLSGMDIEKSSYRELEIKGLDALESEEPNGVSIVTHHLLPLLNVAQLRQQRLDNYQTFLQSAASYPSGDWSPLLQTWPAGAVPFSGVMLCRSAQIRDQLRQYLIEHQIYPAIHWEQRQDMDTGDPQAQDLADRVLTLTLDQRYERQDVLAIMQVVHQFFEQRQEPRFMNKLAVEIAQREIPELTAAQIALLPTEADVQFFEEHGWYISPPILPDAAIAAAWCGCERFYAGERDAELPEIEHFANWTPADGDVLRNNEFVARQIREFQDLALHPVIGAIAARLTRSRTMRLFEEQIIYKPSSQADASGVIGWHTDLAYCSFCTSTVIAGWVPLHDIDESMGPLIVLDRSHQWPECRDLRNFQIDDLASLEQQLQQAGRSVVKIPMTLKRGQVSFHHGRVIHGSAPNHSDRPRIVMAVHLQDGENRFQPIANPNGGLFHHYLDPFCQRLPNGDPDYTDPIIYPTVWTG